MNNDLILEEVFLKYFFQEDNTTFYHHYKEGWAVRQIEVSPLGIKYLSEEHPIDGDSFLADQPLKRVEVDLGEHKISREEFELLWKRK